MQSINIDQSIWKISTKKNETVPDSIQFFRYEFPIAFQR